MIKITAPGIYTDIAAADYFADPCPAPSLTQSIAKILLEQSPRHAEIEHPRLAGGERDGEDYVSARAIGNAAHKLLLERGKEIIVIEANDFRTKEARETRDAVSADGKVPILAKHYGRAIKMVKAAKEQLAPLGLVEFDADTEAVIAWSEDDMWFRSMIDKLSRSRTLVIDYKTSGLSAAPHGIGRIMVDAGWDVQGAMHERGLDAIYPDSAGRRRHLFVMQENFAPYALVVCELSEAVLTMGRKKLQAAVDVWQRCMESGCWPAYPPEIVQPEYPQWRESEWLNREVEREERLKNSPDLVMAG